MKLEPEDLLDVISNTQMLRTWLSKPAAKKIYDDAIFDVLDLDVPRKERKAYLDITKNLNNPDIDPIVLAKAVILYLEDVFHYWMNDSNTDSAAKMVASLPLFVEMSKYLPHVNPSDKYDYAFRGTRIPNVKQFVQSSNPKDWKTTKILGLPFMVYDGAKKNQITYKPHRAVQSWSVSQRGALGFGNEILAVPLDDTFFFDPKFTSQFGYEHEKETVHFGKEPMKTALLVPKPDYLDYRESRNSNWNESINESQEIQDEEGTLTLPGL
jgi:uncharacterized protein (UPF0147 family)